MVTDAHHWGSMETHFEMVMSSRVLIDLVQRMDDLGKLVITFQLTRTTYSQPMYQLWVAWLVLASGSWDRLSVCMA
jgi:hypothetical protein